MKLLRDVFGVEATSVLDPTLLFDSYDEFVPNSQIRKTLVYYPLSEDWELTDYCENLAKKIGLTAINTNRKTTIFNKLIWNRVSIEQWVRNIAYSEFVITRSFHGLAFCLIYQRQFAILKSRNDRGTRLETYCRSWIYKIEYIRIQWNWITQNHGKILLIIQYLCLN